MVLKIVFNDREINQYAKLKYLRCILDQSFLSESMAFNVVDKVNSCLKCLHRKNRFSTPPLRKLLYNVLIQPLLDYAWTAWFSNLSKRLKLRLQESQNKCMSLCLKLNKWSKIRVKTFLQLNWLKVRDSYLQFIVCDLFKFYNNQGPGYFDEFFYPIGDNDVITRSFNKKLKLPFRKTKLGIQSFSYVGPHTQNSLPDN